MLPKTILQSRCGLADTLVAALLVDKHIFPYPHSSLIYMHYCHQHVSTIWGVCGSGTSR